jgi:hypothetical protein
VDICRWLELDFYRSDALERWSAEPTLARYATLESLVLDIRALDDRSDDALRALVEIGQRDELAVEALLVALLPLALSRCARADRVDELLGELAIVVGELGGCGVPHSSRRVANVLLDRAWGRLRQLRRRVGEPVPFDPLELGWHVRDRVRDPADVALGRVLLDDLLDSLRSRSKPGDPAVRAWNIATRLADAETRSESEQQQLRYARRVLRRSLAFHVFA